MAVTALPQAVESERCRTPAHLAAGADPTRTRRMSAIARALADPIRAEIFDVLRGTSGDVCQCELQPRFDISQPTLSHHMHKLAEAGLVAITRRGRWAYYSIDPTPVEDFRSWLGA